MKTRLRVTVTLGATALAAWTAAAGCRALPAKEGRSAPRPFGLDNVIAFTYLNGKADPQRLRSVTFVEPAPPQEWRAWSRRGVVAAVGHTWFDLLRNPAEKAVDILASLNYGGNPRPVVAIDEFGFDFGGEADTKAALILREAKRRKPELGFAVWEMRGPIPGVLADAYRDVADLVLLECYVSGTNEYWWIAAQAAAARLHGLLGKSIVALGVGKGGNPGEEWAQTPAELEQQVRFVRLIAPEAPGIGFYAAGATPELLASADALGGRFTELPTDGSGLPEGLAGLARVFARRYERPTLVCCPQWVEPNRSAADPGKLVQPPTLRACVLNLGDGDARDVEIVLRNPKDKGGDVFAETLVPLVPRRSVTTAALPVTAHWNVWKTWEMEVVAPDSEVLMFKR